MKVIRKLVYEGDKLWIEETLRNNAVQDNEPLRTPYGSISSVTTAIEPVEDIDNETKELQEYIEQEGYDSYLQEQLIELLKAKDKHRIRRLEYRIQFLEEELQGIRRG